MKRLLLAIFLLVQASLYAQVKTPAQLYPGLFEAVQMNRIYADGKTFPDAIPLKKPQTILALYNKEKDRPGFDLKKFVDENFAQPAAAAGTYHSDISAGIRKHIDTLWTVLQRKADTTHNTSLLPLPHPYIVPGGRFREVYYWDSYFTMLGLEESKRYQLMEDIIANFAYLIDTYGHIPNGNRSYYLSRSQPPYFAMMVNLLTQHEGKHILIKYRPELIKEYEYWMEGAAKLKPGQSHRHVVKLTDGSLLNRYWDDSDQPREESYREDVLAAKTSTQTPATFYHNMRAAAESGWDFSSRWFADGQHLGTIQTTALIPVDLNCLLYFMETSIAESYRLTHNSFEAKRYTALAIKRKAAINRYCWDSQHQCFDDYNWVKRAPSAQLSIAMTSPLFFRIADQQRAAEVKAFVTKHFLMPGGVACTVVKSGQQWDRPNGWAPLQYISITGFRNYGYQPLADSLTKRWVKLNIRTFNQTGKMLEKYDIEEINAKAGGGEYPLQDGFGWSNGVLLKLMGARAQ